jgi:hypothetical protein
METSAYFREKARQCRRLAAEIENQDDPIAVGLIALAEEFEAKAVEQSTRAPSDTPGDTR